MSDDRFAIQLSPRRILITLLITSGLLLALSIWGQYLRYFQRFVDIRPWMELGLDILNHKFYMDAETNVPTWFNTALLLAISGILSGIGLAKMRTRDRYRFHWLGLAVLFLLMSLDEAATFHEMLITPMRQWLGLGGWFYFGWVIPGIVLILILGLTYIRFFVHLGPRVRLLLVLALLMYFAGALGAELFSGRLAAALGQRNFTYAAVASLEEAVELIGASLVTYALLLYVQIESRTFEIAIGPK